MAKIDVLFATKGNRQTVKAMGNTYKDKPVKKTVKKTAKKGK